MNISNMSDFSLDNVSLALNATRICADPLPVSTGRFGLVFCGASSVALVGVVSHLALIKSFLRGGKSFNTYLLTLAFLDASICALYILLFGVDIIIYYFNITWLFYAWIYYTIPLLFVSRVAQLSATYLIIAGTLDRWILTRGKGRSRFGETRLDKHLKVLTQNKCRTYVVVGILLSAASLRFVTFFEWQVHTYPNCTNPVASKEIDRIEWNVPAYNIFYGYIMVFIEVFVPFALLCVLNLMVILIQRRYFERQESYRRNRNSQYGRARESMVCDPSDLTSLSLTLESSHALLQQLTNRRQRAVERQQMKQSTYLFIAIIIFYLACNSLSLVVLILERLPGYPGLVDEKGEYTPFFLLSSDLISFLFMFNSFIRFFIHLVFNPDARNQMLADVSCPLAAQQHNDISFQMNTLTDNTQQPNNKQQRRN